jgi:hypothetical protein
MTYQEIKAIYKKKGYKFFEGGDFDLNIFGIRRDDVYDNYFSDRLGIAYKEKGVEKVIIIQATTCPGLHGGRAVMNPRPGGVAVIAPGQYPKVWKFVDDYSTWLSYPFFKQVGTFKIWRDGDKDKELDRVNLQDVAGAGLNGHRMSWNGVKGQPVNNWSEGCQGAEEPEFKKLLEPIRAACILWSPIFTYTLFDATDPEIPEIKAVFS